MENDTPILDSNLSVMNFIAARIIAGKGRFVKDYTSGEIEVIGFNLTEAPDETD